MITHEEVKDWYNLTDLFEHPKFGLKKFKLDDAYQFDDPIFNLDGSIAVHRSPIYSVEKIVRLYWPYWFQQMSKIGKWSQISLDNCVDDWITTNWALKVRV